MAPSVVPVLHNVSSVQRVVDMARLVYALDFDLLVVTKAYGGAAQSGVPEAMRLALKEGKSLIVLPDLGDAIELMKPDSVVAVTPRSPEELVTGPGDAARILNGKTMIVFSGGEPDFTASELSSASKRVYIGGVKRKLGPVAEASIILYSVSQALGSGEE